MNKLFSLRTSLVVATMLALPVAQAATMTKDEYKAAKTRIGTDYKADKTACATLAGNAKDICVEEAQAREKVARAELQYSHTNKTSDGYKLRVARAESAYAVAKEKCDDKAGNVKDVCITEAKAIETKALADAKLGKEIGEARNDASVDKRDADYKVAAEKCDVMSGESKDNCMAAAKAKYGKS